MSSLYAITTYYNPAGYRRRLQNYKVFRDNLNCPLITIEHSVNGQFELKTGDADILIQLDGGSTLWQKERLLNIAIDHVPNGIKNVAWIDCDMIFLDPAWTLQTEKLLNDFDFVQLFSELIDLPKNAGFDFLNFSGDASIPSLTYALQQSGDRDDIFQVSLTSVVARSSVPGGAWASKIDIVKHIGFYDHMVLGSGDSAFAQAIFDETESFIIKTKMGSAWRDEYLNWTATIPSESKERVGFRSGTIFHLWHGNISNRQYGLRHNILAEVDFVPSRDLVMCENGLWHLKNDKSNVAAAIEFYFATRHEDGVSNS